jgi:hypothetical protein
VGCSEKRIRRLFAGVTRSVWHESESFSPPKVSRSIAASFPEGSLLLLCLALLLYVLSVLSIYAPKRMDFAVYWYDINAFVHSGTPLYGSHSAFGFPMLFRYPPAFVLLFHPLSLLSFRAAGCVWAIAEALTITAITYWMYVKLQLAITLKIGLLALAICAPYFYLSFKDGNMQWLVTMLVLVAVLSAETCPAPAGLMLALGIVIKVWPILFLPLFLMRERRRSLLATAAWSAAIWTFPLLAFGPALYGRLLQDWSRQEFANHVGLRDIWYPSQSLRGVLLRFFTDPVQTLPYHSDFPDVHVLTLPPGLLILLWITVSVAAFLYVTRRICSQRTSNERNGTCATSLSSPRFNHSVTGPASFR